MEWMVNKEKKKSLVIYIFIDSEELGHLPTYPWGIRTS